MIKTPSTSATGAPAPDDAPGSVLDAERLGVYHLALEFHGRAASFALRGDSVLRDQLRRASLSVVLNIAEGAGRRSKAQKRHFYGIARGSAMESAAIVDVLRVRQLATADECREARALLVRVVQMLSRLEQSLR